MSYAVMPMADYKATCDKVREKTETAELIKSGELPQKIDEVYREGQLSVFSSSEALKGEAEGNPISITDVSPVEHDVSVKVSGDAITDFSGVKVTVGGKNLLNLNRTPGTLKSGTNGKRTDFEFDKYYEGITRNNIYVGSIYATATIENNVITVNTKNAYYGIGIPFKVKPNTNYIFSGKVTGSPHIRIAYYDNEGNYLTTSGNPYEVFTTPENCTVAMLSIVGQSANSIVTATNIQIEADTTIHEYEPYIEPTEYAANADGTVEGIKSKYPSMSFTTDTEGVNISVEYYKDIDKVLQNLAINTALSGGE